MLAPVHAASKAVSATDVPANFRGSPYISIVIAVHDARLAASSSCGVGASSSPMVAGLVGQDLVPADVDPVG